MNKKELRIRYKQFRQALNDDEVEELSVKIANKTLRLPIWDNSTFHIFLPIEHHREVNTEYLLHLLSGKDKNIVISKSDFETRDMTHYLLSDNTKISLNSYGIPEPVSGLEIAVHNIDVVFVPLLAFDQSGHRVGYGKGFYDKFLAQCKPSTVKIGLSFFGAELHCTDTFEGDVKLDYCVTPQQIYQF